MSEIAEDRAYYEAAEAAFIRRRGTPFLLSPRDFLLLQEWRALGIPLEVVEAGIDEAFTRREERGALSRVGSLAYCRDAVLEAWERRLHTGTGRGRAGDIPAPDVAAALERLTRSLEEAKTRRLDLAGALETALRSLSRLSGSDKSPEEVEASLARLDRRLAKELYEAMPEEERRALDADVARQLAGAGDRMDPATLEKTTRALTRRAVRESLDLPRLSLL